MLIWPYYAMMSALIRRTVVVVMLSVVPKTSVHYLPCIDSHWRIDRGNNTTPACHYMRAILVSDDKCSSYIHHIFKKVFKKNCRITNITKVGQNCCKQFFLLFVFVMKFILRIGPGPISEFRVLIF